MTATCTLLGHFRGADGAPIDEIDDSKASNPSLHWGAACLPLQRCSNADLERSAASGACREFLCEGNAGQVERVGLQRGESRYRSGRQQPFDTGTTYRVERFVPAGKQLADEIRTVADEQHVAAGAVGGRRASDDIAGNAGAFHRQIIAENDTIKFNVVS